MDFNKGVSDENVLLILGICIGYFIGVVFVIFVSSTMGTTIVKNTFLDNVCNNTFGENYIYEDNEIFGTDLEITCKLNKPIEENWIGLK